MKRILFQGDSITDCSRSRENLSHMGYGYPFLVKAELGAERPGEFEFINRGISGNRVVDLYARIKADFINLAPDLASIYIGVNDTWHEIGSRNGVDTAKFERIYTMLLEEVRAALPDIRLIIIAPFVLEGPATCDTAEIPDRLARFRSDVAEKAAVCRRLAERFDLPLIELQEAFDSACTRAPAAYWTADGVHPTECGHQLIRRLWLDAFARLGL